MGAITRIRSGDAWWTVRSDLAGPFEALLRDRIADPRGRDSLPKLKENLVRTVYRVPFPTPTARELILKDYRTRRWDQWLRHLVRPSKAAAEWRAMRRLSEAGFPTAEPVGYGEARRGPLLVGCSFASIAIPDVVPFPDRCRAEARRGIEGRRDLLRSLAGLIAALHARGAHHRDLHAGNVLCAGDDLYLIDLHRARFPSVLPRRTRLAEVARMCHSLSFFAEPGDLSFLVRAYGDAAGIAPITESETDAVLRRVRRLERERIRSRSLRCVKNSSEFRRARIPGGILYHRRSVPEEVLRRARADHGTITGGDALLHASPRARVTRVETPQGALAVKEYLYPRASHILENALRGSPARRAYIAGRGLEEIGIPTPRVVGLLEDRRLGVAVRSFLFTEYVAGEPLEAHLSRYNDPDRRHALAPDRRAFLRDLAGAVRRIHDAGVYQPDMAGQNFLVARSDGATALHLVDLDRVRLGRRIDRPRRLRNLSQIGHMPGTITRADRLRFLRAYASGDGRLGDRETARILGAMIDRKAAEQRDRIERILRRQRRRDGRG